MDRDTFASRFEVTAYDEGSMITCRGCRTHLMLTMRLPIIDAALELAEFFAAHDACQPPQTTPEAGGSEGGQDDPQ
jgi:hypothetical protein